MAPTQLTRQGSDDFRIGKLLCKLHHTRECVPSESPTVFNGQLLRHCRNNLFSILSPFLAENVLPNSSANLPMEQDEPGINNLRHLAPRGLD